MAFAPGGRQRRRGTGELPEKEQETLLGRWNSSKKADALVKMAMYFAGARTAANVCMTDVDAAGFTLRYVEKHPDTGLQQVETRVQFDQPVHIDLDEIMHKINSMAEEARIVLNLKPSTDYVAPGTRVPQTFVMPGAGLWISAMMLWLSAAVMAFAPTLPPALEQIRNSVSGGQSTFATILYSVIFINAVEALVAVGFGVWSQLPNHDIFKWWLVTHLFGFATLGDMIKISFKRHEQLESTKEIKT